MRSEQGAERRRTLYSKLLETGGRVVAQARRFAAEVKDGVKRSLDPLDDALLHGLRRQLEDMVERVEQVRGRPSSACSTAMSMRPTSC